jgi:MFS family permease
LISRLATLRPLHHRNFALLAAASLVSNVGSWMQTVGVGALVTADTGRATWTALVAAAAFLPIGLLSPIGGALADRLDRRRWMAIANLVQAGLAALLAVLTATGRASPAAVTIVVFLAGSVQAMILPFQQALIPDLVPKQDVLGAASLGAAGYNLGRVLGPALAAVVIAITSYTWAFAINAASFLVVVGALCLIRLPHHIPARESERLFKQIRAGARAAWDEPGCRSAILLIACAAFLASPFIALIPAKAALLTDGGRREIGATTGALTTAQGVGAVMGALLLTPLAERLGRQRVLVFDLIATPLALCAYAMAPSTFTAVVALAAVGACYIGILSGLNAVVQLRAPDGFRARILSLYLMALGSIYPVGEIGRASCRERVFNIV